MVNLNAESLEKELFGDDVERDFVVKLIWKLWGFSRYKHGKSSYHTIIISILP